MAQVPNSVIEIINNFLDSLKNDNIKISRAVLFGSYVKGNYDEYSDIDLAIVSEQFQGNFFYDNKIIQSSKLKTSCDLEVHTYQPDDFNDDNPFVREILSYGIELIK
jgi:predicted nucleotidyltransferase